VAKAKGGGLLLLSPRRGGGHQVPLISVWAAWGALRFGPMALQGQGCSGKGVVPLPLELLLAESGNLICNQTQRQSTTPFLGPAGTLLFYDISSRTL